MRLASTYDMRNVSMLDSETGGAPGGFTYLAQYGVRRPSHRPDVYRTQFGSMSADEYLTPMLRLPQRDGTNIARHLSRNSFLIPPQTLARRMKDGMFIKIMCYSFTLFHFKFPKSRKSKYMRTVFYSHL